LESRLQQDQSYYNQSCRGQNKEPIFVDGWMVMLKLIPSSKIQQDLQRGIEGLGMNE
jgi:hypothetical protein